MYLRHKTGKIGEDLACNYLEKLGYKIIERNFETWYGEIDIIALDKKEVVFVEVKTRTNTKYGYAVEAVNDIKIKHLKKAINYYLYNRGLENEFVRIDVIEIYIYGKKYKVNYIKHII